MHRRSCAGVFWVPQRPHRERVLVRAQEVLERLLPEERLDLIEEHFSGLLGAVGLSCWAGNGAGVRGERALRGRIRSGVQC